ncbi:MATE efflux family protein [Auriscalpium vulgare]|uniref:MATE efflux family protein n=1 Tax=Auriscalpium vulgare TaxID=40419 RepID=A0ACB8S3V9_9AGAM|nr:MATE efflux family protein [Auriscalpium vulgare]
MSRANERTRLLIKPSTSSTLGNERSQLLETAVHRQPRGGREILALFKSSIPVIFSYILQNSIQTVAVLVVGRLGPDELSVAAFSLMLAFAFTGSQRSTDLSVIFQRCLIMLWLLFIPVGIAWANMAPILISLGQDPQLSYNTQQYLRWLLLGAPGYIAFESLKKYLQCQGIMDAATYVLFVLSPVNIALNIYLVHYTPLAMTGSPVALSITFWLAFFTLSLYAAYSPSHKRNGTWGGLQLRAALEPKSCIIFLKLALPGILMVGTEWAAFEIVALAAARIGHVSLAAQSVIMTTDQSVAASTRVGNLIGSRDSAGAKFSGHISALLSVVTGTIVMIGLLCSKDIYGYLFSDDEEVVQLVSKVMPLVASFQIADGLAGSCGGVLRGQGRQHIGALFNILAYYVLALPLGISLAFRTNLGLQGLWIGQVVALFIVGLGEYGVVWFGTDWDYEIRKGYERYNHDSYLSETSIASA